MNRFPLITVRPNIIPAPQSESINSAVSSKQSGFEQSQSGHATESGTSNNDNQRKRRASTPTAISNQPSSSSGGADNLNRSINEAPFADIVPDSPQLVCPPSPPPAAPSAHGLAVSRMIEMNADMEFAYARLMMLDHEQRRIEARLETLEKIQLQEGKNI
jgi:hypothetical protein